MKDHNLRFPYVFQFIEEWNRGAIFVRTSVKVRKNCQKFDLYNSSKQYKSSPSAMDQNTPDRQDSRNRLASSQRFLINQLIQLKHWNWNTQSTPGVNSILANILLNPSKYFEPFFLQSMRSREGRNIQQSRPSQPPHQMMWKVKEGKVPTNRKSERLPVKGRRNHGAQPVGSIVFGKWNGKENTTYSNCDNHVFLIGAA